MFIYRYLCATFYVCIFFCLHIYFPFWWGPANRILNLNCRYDHDFMPDIYLPSSSVFPFSSNVSAKINSWAVTMEAKRLGAACKNEAGLPSHPPSWLFLTPTDILTMKFLNQKRPGGCLKCPFEQHPIFNCLLFFFTLVLCL